MHYFLLEYFQVTDRLMQMEFRFDLILRYFSILGQRNVNYEFFLILAFLYRILNFMGFFILFIYILFPHENLKRFEVHS